MNIQLDNGQSLTLKWKLGDEVQIFKRGHWTKGKVCAIHISLMLDFVTGEPKELSISYSVQHGLKQTFGLRETDLKAVSQE